MTYVIRIESLADGSPSVVDGQYLQLFEPGFGGGRGRVESAPTADGAQMFATHAEAVAEYERVAPAPHDVLPGGEPNRPFTAYGVRFVEIS